MTSASLPTRKPKSLAQAVVDAFTQRVLARQLTPGDKLPTEAAIMAEFGVSRTVVREALSKLQAAGLVETRHGIGTFVTHQATRGAPSFHIRQEQLATLQDVIAAVELRIGVETEAAALAARRRSEADVVELRAALDAITEALEAGQESVAQDYRFHLAIAQATRNPRFAELLSILGPGSIPRGRIDEAAGHEDRQEYLRRVNSEHRTILEAIANQDSEAARAAMRIHLTGSCDRLRRASIDTAPR
jgi:DNA-binding FadR family transcriptional regulator